MCQASFGTSTFSHNLYHPRLRRWNPGLKQRVLEFRKRRQISRILPKTAENTWFYQQDTIAEEQVFRHVGKGATWACKFPSDFVERFWKGHTSSRIAVCSQPKTLYRPIQGDEKLHRSSSRRHPAVPTRQNVLEHQPSSRGSEDPPTSIRPPGANPLNEIKRGWQNDRPGHTWRNKRKPVFNQFIGLAAKRCYSWVKGRNWDLETDKEEGGGEEEARGGQEMNTHCFCLFNSTSIIFSIFLYLK